MSQARIRVVENHVVAGDEVAKQDSRFHTFPSLTRCSDGSFLCTALVGSAKSGPDGRTKVFKSTDACRTWEQRPSPTVWDEKADARWGYMMCHIIETSPGRLLAAYLRTDRFHPDEPLFHPKTSGMQRAVVRLSESRDNGQTWSSPRDLNYRLPDLIAPGQFMQLPDGSLGMPFEVWHEWDKGFREGPSTRFVVSDDDGRTWPETGMIARDKARHIIYGDPRLTMLPDGRLVVLLWMYNLETEQDFPVHRAESSDNGRTWSSVHNTEIVGQIANPASLRDGLMLAVYQKRFGAEAGLRAMLSYDDGLTWDTRTDTVIWGLEHHTDQKNPFSGYEEYAFGYSTVLRLSEHEVLVPFWVSNGKTTYIRLLKVSVE